MICDPLDLFFKIAFKCPILLDAKGVVLFFDKLLGNLGGNGT
jgi:hypothetical protein